VVAQLLARRACLVVPAMLAPSSSAHATAALASSAGRRALRRPLGWASASLSPSGLPVPPLPLCAASSTSRSLASCSRAAPSAPAYSLGGCGSVRGIADTLAARTLAAAGYPVQPQDVRRKGKGPAKSSSIPAGTPYSKELRLLAHVLETATPGDPLSVCEAIESFGKNVLNPGGQWLKVAGDAKAVVLTSAMRGKPKQGSILEIGCYCGYSAIRMAMALPGVRIVTLEVDPAHVVIARNMVAFAGLAHVIDVWTGHSKDLLTRIPDRYGGVDKFRVSGVFMDQRGSRYDEDLGTMERLGILLPGCVVVCDNVLKPGSPTFLWRLQHGGTYDNHFVKLTEFAMPAEDWMSVSVRRADAPLAVAGGGGEVDAKGAEPPEELAQLQWEADRMRAQATRVPGVTFQEWAAFAEHMREGMARHGIVATLDAEQLIEEPWLVLGVHGSPPADRGEKEVVTLDAGTPLPPCYAVGC